jgi:hypothetical protein
MPDSLAERDGFEPPVPLVLAEGKYSPKLAIFWRVFARFRMYSVRRACQEKYLRPAYAGDAPPGRFCERARF